MGELLHFSRDPQDRKPPANGELIEIPTDMMANTLAERRRSHMRIIDAVIDEVPKHLPEKVDEAKPPLDLIEVPKWDDK